MQATNSRLTDFIGATKQYYIPIFQRDYSWDTSDCDKLLSDVIDVANDDGRPCHFIGSIIYLPKTQFASTINECAIIDGQQRLTTISLLLLALAYYSKEYYSNEAYSASETNLDQIKEMYLINKFGKKQLKYKLRLNGDDDKAYKSLIESGLQTNDCNESRLFINLKHLYDSMKGRRIDPAIVLNGIHKLLLVDIPLNREDNAQLVFETVNSTGKELTETQKIKNYILMTVDPDGQEDLYNHYWLPMEREISSEEFDTFIRYYLTIKNKEQVPIRYYEEFKKYVRASRLSTVEIVCDIKQYFDLYLKWKNAGIDSYDDVYRFVWRVKRTKQDKVTPTVLQILYDVQTGKCFPDQAKEVLSIIEAYFMRRKICSLPTNSAGSVCFIMLKSLGKEDYANGFKRLFFSLTEAQRMPSNEEVKDTLRTIQFYNKDFDREVLDEMEIHQNKDYIHSANHSIEHIMPQTVYSHEELYEKEDLSDEKKEKTDWALDLGPEWERIHKTYVDTLGNLTITGYNSEYQNYRFKYKRDMENGYSHSPIRITAESLKDKEKWGESEIIERSDWLSSIICDIWRYPTEV